MKNSKIDLCSNKGCGWMKRGGGAGWCCSVLRVRVRVAACCSLLHWGCETFFVVAHLFFDVCTGICVCACGGWVHGCMCVCVWCVCDFAVAHLFLIFDTCRNMCVCVCVYVCVCGACEILLWFLLRGCFLLRI